MRNITIQPGFPSVAHERLIQKCAEVLESKVLVVAPLGRVGYSGAVLYKAHATGGRPIVIKTDKAPKIKREHLAIKRIQAYFKTQLMCDPFYVDGLGALLYDNIGGTPDNLDRLVELRELVYDFSKASDERVSDLLHRTYKRLKLETSATVRSRIELKRDYWRYKRVYQGTDRSALVVNAVVGASSKGRRVSLLGARIIDPRKFEAWLLRQEFELSRGPVHGDLHPNNVVLDIDRAPHVIDFAWASPLTHRLVDCVLMECSLRFHMFPRFVNHQEQLMVDRLLLDCDGTSDVRRATRHSELRKYYTRMASLVECVRTQRKALGCQTSDFNEYLISQFLVLYGLLQYEGYNNAIVVRALGLIANKLASDYS